MKFRRGPSDLTRNVLAAWLVLAVVAAAVFALFAFNDTKPSASRAMLPSTHWSVRSPVRPPVLDEEPDPPRTLPPAEFLDDRAPASRGDVVVRATE